MDSESDESIGVCLSVGIVKAPPSSHIKQRLVRIPTGRLHANALIDLRPKYKWYYRNFLA